MLLWDVILVRAKSAAASVEEWLAKPLILGQSIADSILYIQRSTTNDNHRAVGADRCFSR